MVSAGGIIYASDYNAIADITLNKPVCNVRQATGGQALANNTAVALTWDTEDLDTHGAHSTASNTDRITPQKAGWYTISSTVVLASRSDYTRIDVVIEQNGATLIPSRTREAPGATAGSASAYAEVDAYFNGTTDYCRVVVTQTNAAAAASSTASSGSFSPSCRTRFVRP